MERNLETTPPLSHEEYARTFDVYTANSGEWEAMKKVSRTVIEKSKFDVKPVRMLTIGAGTGHFEKTLVEEVGLKLEYVCAIEPNPEHVTKLNENLKSLDIQYETSMAFFNADFKFEEHFKTTEKKFELILFCHSLYGFEDPFEAVTYAAKFLKPTGIMLIINQCDPCSAEMFTYLADASDPSIFSPRLSIGDHSLTAKKIIQHFQEKLKDHQIDIFEELVLFPIDSFIRKTGEPGSCEVVSFMIQAEYTHLSKEAQDGIYDIVAKDSVLVEGKYLRKHKNVAIVLSPAL